MQTEEKFIHLILPHLSEESNIPNLHMRKLRSKESNLDQSSTATDPFSLHKVEKQGSIH